MPERSRSRRRWIGAVAAAVALVAVLAGLLLWARLSPWIESPKVPGEDIERRWDSVREWAERDADPGPIGPLDELEVDARPAARELDRLLERFADDEGELPRILDAELDGPARRTIARLEAWHRSDGGLGAAACLDAEPDVLAARDAVRIALLGAESPDAERVEAALALVAALQRHGSLLQAFVGDALAMDAARVFADRGWSATGALRRARPAPEALFTAIARDAICNERTMGALAGEGTVGDWTVHDDLSGVADEWPPLGLIDLERERLVLRSHFGALVEAAHAHRDDYAAMADAMAPIEADRPRSVFVSIMAIDVADRVRERAETRARFDALVGGLPRGVEPGGEAGSPHAD